MMYLKLDLAHADPGKWVLGIGIINIIYLLL